jgi:hypothetical protein
VAENISLGLGHALLRIHRAISRGLIVSVGRGEEFVRDGFPDAGTRTGYALYIQGLAAVLDAHHLGEDEIAFPALRGKVISAPYERLARNHQEIVVLLGQAGAILPQLEEKGAPADLAALVEVLHKIADIWRPHIQTEEWYFSPEALAAVMDAQEQVQIGAWLAKHAQEHATPPQLALPFMLFNLEKEDRAGMASTLPAVVVEQLIPKAWKGQWAPMQPFLLE